MPLRQGDKEQSFASLAHAMTVLNQAYPMDSPHKGQKCGALMFSMRLARTNSRVAPDSFQRFEMPSTDDYAIE